MLRKEIHGCFVIPLLFVASWTQVARGDTESQRHVIRGMTLSTATADPGDPAFSRGVNLGCGLLNGSHESILLICCPDGFFTMTTVITNVHGSIFLFGVGTVSGITNTFTNDSIVVGGTGLFEGAIGEFSLDGVILPQVDGPDMFENEFVGTLFINRKLPN